MEPCLIDRLNAIPPSRPWGAHQFGHRSEPVTHWPGYAGLDPDAQEWLDRVWAGELKYALLPDRTRTWLNYVKHSTAGVPCEGRHYGYTVRSIELPPPAVAPRPPQRRGWVAGVAAVAAVAAAAGWAARSSLAPTDVPVLAATPGPPAPITPTAAAPTEEARLRAEVARLQKELATAAKAADEKDRVLREVARTAQQVLGAEPTAAKGGRP
jgi:hypothetical protein